MKTNSFDVSPSNGDSNHKWEKILKVLREDRRLDVRVLLCEEDEIAGDLEERVQLEYKHPWNKQRPRQS